MHTIPTSHHSHRPSKIFLSIFVWLLLGLSVASAHPMPNSLVLLQVEDQQIRAEVQLPLAELRLVLPWVISLPDGQVKGDAADQIREYVLSHIAIKSGNGDDWTTDLTRQEITTTPDSLYKELVLHLVMKPIGGGNIRKFDLYYDLIIHEVFTHKIFVKIGQDWENGVLEETDTQVGVIEMDTRTASIYPLEVRLDEGSLWKGFMTMLKLGMHHIQEGTDHLLFLLVLLLPAPLIAQNRKWERFGGARYTLIRLLKIVTAFTIGHSVTLIFGAVGWLILPVQPVEILIGVSILVTAIHALRPLFPNRETWIAVGFGLIHGSAFAGIIGELRLPGEKMALSILGFNLGIELMQLVVILLFSPLLLLLGQSPKYRYFRIAGAVLSILAAVYWIWERF